MDILGHIFAHKDSIEFTITVTSTVVSLVLFAYGLVQTIRLKRSERYKLVEGKRLKLAEDENKELALEIDQQKQRISNLKERIPETTLTEVAELKRSGKQAKIYYALEKWLMREGGPTALLFLEAAQIAFVFSQGRHRPAALSLASQYARTAAILDPKNRNATDLSRELDLWKTLEGHPDIALSDALPQLEEAISAQATFHAESLEIAAVNLSEAQTFWQRGMYHLADLKAQAAYFSFRDELGENANQTLEARGYRAQILRSCGRYDEALSEIDSTLAGFLVGPLNPVRKRAELNNHRTRATILRNLVRYDEALIEARLAAERLSELFGVNDKDSLSAQHELAEMLMLNGNLDQAEATIVSVIAERERLFGGLDDSVLKSRHLHGRVLHKKGKLWEAYAQEAVLVAALKVLKRDTHPDCLAARHICAAIQFDMKEYSKALEEIENVISMRDEHPSFGIGHPMTLQSRCLRARLLAALGRPREGADVMNQVVKLARTNRSLGPESPETRYYEEELRRINALT